MLICGILMRDTAPNSLDLQNRASSIASLTSAPMSVELTAWYCPRHIQDWPDILKGPASAA